MREPVITISLLGVAGAADAWLVACPAATSGGGSVLCAQAGLVPADNAHNATLARRAESYRFINSPQLRFVPEACVTLRKLTQVRNRRKHTVTLPTQLSAAAAIPRQLPRRL